MIDVFEICTACLVDDVVALKEGRKRVENGLVHSDRARGAAKDKDGRYLRLKLQKFVPAFPHGPLYLFPDRMSGARDLLEIFFRELLRRIGVRERYPAREFCRPERHPPGCRIGVVDDDRYRKNVRGVEGRKGRVSPRREDDVGINAIELKDGTDDAYSGLKEA